MNDARAAIISTPIERSHALSLFNAYQVRQLLHNGLPENRHRDHFPVVKLHMTALPCTWLLSWLDPDDGDTAYGLCDPGICAPRTSSITLSGLADLNDALGFAVERDPHFVPLYPLSVYARAAQKAGHFTEVAAQLTAAARPRLPVRLIPLHPQF